MKQRTSLWMIPAAALLAISPQLVLAETAGTTDAAAPTRAEVKAETNRAAKSGEIVKDQVGLTKAAQVPLSTESRADIKADAKAAVKSGKATKPAAAKNDPKKDPQQ